MHSLIGGRAGSGRGPVRPAPLLLSPGLRRPSAREHVRRVPPGRQTATGTMPALTAVRSCRGPATARNDGPRLGSWAASSGIPAPMTSQTVSQTTAAAPSRPAARLPLGVIAAADQQRAVHGIVLGHDQDAAGLPGGHTAHRHRPADLEVKTGRWLLRAGQVNEVTTTTALSGTHQRERRPTTTTAGVTVTRRIRHWSASAEQQVWWLSVLEGTTGRRVRP